MRQKFSTNAKKIHRSTHAKKNHRNNGSFFFALFIAALLFFLQQVLSYYPRLVELIYSKGIAPKITQVLSIIPSFFSGSLAEFLIYAHLLVGIFYLLHLAILLVSRQWNKVFAKVTRLITYLLILYSLFMFLWGFHYLRPSAAERLNLDTKPRSVSELQQLTAQLIDEAIKHQAESLDQSQKSDLILKEMYISLTMQNFAKSKVGQELGLIQGTLSPPKAVMYSEGMSYLGITGIYMPFTGEGNYNNHLPPLFVPATMAHELAHQRGIAPEDEANFVAYLATQQSDNPRVRYSGTMLALVHSMNALYKKAPEEARALRKNYSERMNEDFNTQRIYWKRYEGEISQTQEKINDSYLKFNQQESGVASYGQMVDLLLAYNAQGKK